MTDERIEQGRRVRKLLRERVPGCVAAVDHAHFIGAYVLAEALEQAEELVKKSSWGEIPVEVRIAPPVLSRR